MSHHVKLSETTSHHIEIPARQILVLAACAGLLTGIVEGAGLLVFQEFGWLSWERMRRHVTLEIVAISAGFDLILFSLGGLVWAGASVLARPLRDARFVFGVLASLAFFDWLSVAGYLQDFGTLFLAVGLAVALVRMLKMRLPAVLPVLQGIVPLVFAVGMLAVLGIPFGLWAKRAITQANLPTPAPNAPNVLFVVMDTLRANEVSAYGYHRETTPNLDRLSRQGVLFEQAFSASSWSAPAHASLLTGRYPFEHRVEWNHPLDDRFPTLPEVFLSRGYVTAALSGNKWWFNPAVGFDRGFISFDTLYHSLGDAISRTLYGRMLDTHVFGRMNRMLGWRPMMGEQVTEKALKWVDAHRGRPFFLFVNFIDCHEPYVSPSRFRTKFTPEGKAEPCRASQEKVHELTITPEVVRACTDAYDGAVAYTDYTLGQLLMGLQQRGQLDKTLVVVTSDHGEMLFEHGLFEHRNSLYLPEIRVPLVISWPSRIPPEVRVAVPVSTAFVPRTILDVVGDARQGEFPGRSLRALWENPAEPTDWPWPLSELGHFPFIKSNPIPAKHGSLKSLVTPKWHYIAHDKLGEELYDWRSDPHEEHNLIRTAEAASVADAMRSELIKMGATSGAGIRGPRDR